MSDEQEVVVFETTDPNELNLARNLLEQAGVPFRVDGGGSSSFLGAVLGPQILGFQEVVVPVEFEARAIATLRDAWPERALDKED